MDLKYFFKITLAVFTGLGRPTEVEGLATFDKKVILCAVRPNQVHQTTVLVHSVDPNAFVIVTTAGTISGEGFESDGLS